MQCSSDYRDPYETAAWQLYLRECALRTAREEVAFLEAVGGATKEELDRIRQRVMACGEEPVPDDTTMMMQNNTHMLGLMGQGATVKGASFLAQGDSFCNAFNNNGGIPTTRISVAELSMLTGTECSAADLNRDGLVNAKDIAIWQRTQPAPARKPMSAKAVDRD